VPYAACIFDSHSRIAHRINFVGLFFGAFHGLYQKYLTKLITWWYNCQPTTFRPWMPQTSSSQTDRQTNRQHYHANSRSYCEYSVLCAAVRSVNYTTATSLCDDLGTCWPSHATFHNRWPCLCCCRTGCLEQPARGRMGIYIAAAVPTSAQGWAVSAFSGPKTLNVTFT